MFETFDQSRSHLRHEDSVHVEGCLSTTDAEVALIAVGLVFRPGLSFLHHVVGVHDAHQASVVGDRFLLSFISPPLISVLNVARLNVARETLLVLEHAAAGLAGKNLSVVPVSPIVLQTIVFGD